MLPARRTVASVALLVLAAQEALAARVTGPPVNMICIVFAAALVLAGAGVAMRFAIARWIAIGAGIAGLTQALVLAALCGLSTLPLAIAIVGVGSGAIIAALSGGAMARHCDRGAGSLWRRARTTPKWLATSVIGAAAAVPMLLVYAHMGPWWVTDAHRLVAWSLAAGFAAAGVLVALERTAGILMMAPLALMTLGLVIDGVLWLNVGARLGMLGAVATAPLLPSLLFATVAAGGAFATLCPPMAHFLRAPR